MGGSWLGCSEDKGCGGSAGSGHWSHRRAAVQGPVARLMVAQGSTRGVRQMQGIRGMLTAQRNVDGVI